MDVHASNLLSALKQAIDNQREYEKRSGLNYDSSYLAGIEDLYRHVQKGGQIHIKHS